MADKPEFVDMISEATRQSRRAAPRIVDLDPRVEPVDERIDRGATADALEQIAAGEGAMNLAMGQEATMVHAGER